MSALVFRTPKGPRVCLDAMDVVRVWEGIEPGTVTLETIDDSQIDVVGDFDTIVDVIWVAYSVLPEDMEFEQPDPQPHERLIRELEKRDRRKTRL